MINLNRHKEIKDSLKEAGVKFRTVTSEDILLIHFKMTESRDVLAWHDAFADDTGSTPEARKPLGELLNGLKKAIAQKKRSLHRLNDKEKSIRLSAAHELERLLLIQQKRLKLNNDSFSKQKPKTATTNWLMMWENENN